MEKQKDIKRVELKSWMTRQNLLIVVVIVLFLFQYFQTRNVAKLVASLKSSKSALISEMGELKETYGVFGQDLNEVRNFLRLPKKNYLGFEQADEEVAEPEIKTDLEEALYKYISSLAETRKRAASLKLNQSYLESLSNSKPVLSLLEEQVLHFSELVEEKDQYSLQILTKEGDALIYFYTDKADGKFYLKTPKSKEELRADSFGIIQGKVIALINSEKNLLVKHLGLIRTEREKIIAALKSTKVDEVLSQLNISVDEQPANKDLKLSYQIYNKNREPIGEIVFGKTDLKTYLIDKNNEDFSLHVTDIETALIPFLQKLDNKTFLEKKSLESLEKLQETMDSNDFRSMLEENGFRTSDKPRETRDRIYYDIYDGKDTHISSLVVEKATGVINIVQPDGTKAVNLLYFDPDSKKKTLEIPEEIPDYGDVLSQEDEKLNILLAGRNGGNFDTLIFAQVNEKDHTVKLISIPRDLHYNGRKINALARLYGIEELKKVISKISGYKLDHYVAIDMEGFIEAIDMIGGIDLTLQTSVIDPSYRVIDNGIEGTLNYEPGDYHLTGVEALRLARSRKTSSDFVRADRQQMILKAVQEKAKNFGIGDADTIYQIIKTFLAMSETDISLDDAITYYFRYQNYEIVSNDVISTSNILYSPPYTPIEQCASKVAGSKESEECENANHAYTLLPDDNNWNLIKWFFKDKFEG